MVIPNHTITFIELEPMKTTKKSDPDVVRRIGLNSKSNN